MIYIFWHEFCYWGGMVVAFCEFCVDVALMPLGGIYYLCRRRYPDCFIFWLSRKIDHHNVATFGSNIK
ncbi:MAG: hypothetical protein PHW01_02360 [Patescibacteria group bacterium]|nr:hypothetical protein [Patescibacteria group bacterium]